MSTEPEPNPVDRPGEMPPEGTPPAASEPNPPPAAPAGAVSKEDKDKKVISGILAILLGWLGIHKFYLGYQKEGIIMLVVSLVAGGFTCGAGAGVVAIIGLIEGILYLTKTDEEFVRTYVTGRKPWF